MGEDGEGSREPGVASGEEFVVSYPKPFLDYYYLENPLENGASNQTPSSPPADDDTPLSAGTLAAAMAAAMVLPLNLRRIARQSLTT